VPPIVHEVLRTPGQPLDASTRAFMEARFGHSFGRVSVEDNTTSTTVQRKETQKAKASEVPAISHQSLNSSSQPSKSETLTFREPRLNHDFSQVRIHTDAKAAESARAINALAYTAKQNIVFGNGQYAPQTHSGRQLIAHELAHVVQQDNSWSCSVGGIDPPNSTQEGEARVVADAIVQGNDMPRLSPSLMSTLSRDAVLVGEGSKIQWKSRGLTSGSEIRNWVRDVNLAAIGEIPLQEKLRLINRLLDYVVYNEDLDAIEKICSSVPSIQEVDAIRTAISPRAIDLSDLGKRSRLRVILSRTPQSFSHSVYEEKLHEAVRKLSSVNFGRAEWDPEFITQNPGKPLSNREKWYDPEFWTIDDQAKALRLKPGKRPSDAIDAIFSNLEKWSLDCMQFEQVAQLYAQRWALLPEPDRFNEKVSPTAAGAFVKPNFLRQHGSFGMRSKEIYERERGDTPLVRRSDKMPMTNVDELLDNAPVGSRIVWTNEAAEMKDVFRNENTIKLGKDKFAAHGFQSKSDPIRTYSAEMSLN
jgi:hypothetical protein